MWHSYQLMWSGDPDWVDRVEAWLGELGHAATPSELASAEHRAVFLAIAADEVEAGEARLGKLTAEVHTAADLRAVLETDAWLFRENQVGTLAFLLQRLPWMPLGGDEDALCLSVAVYSLAAVHGSWRAPGELLAVCAAHRIELSVETWTL